MAGIFVFIAVCDPSWCADTSIFARIALSLSVAGTFVFIAVVSFEIYSGMCVSTAPVAEPTVMSFTVPLNGWTIVGHYYCCDLVLFVGRCLATGVFASRCRLVVVFSPGGAYDSVWDSVKPIAGNTLSFLGCVCMLNGWFSNIDDICADNYNFSRFKLKDKCRSEQWEVICAVT